MCSGLLLSVFRLFFSVPNALLPPSHPHSHSPGYRFQPHIVKKVLQDCIDTKLKGFSYDPSRASTLTKQLSNEIIYAVKNLGYNRYKLVVQASL